AAMPVSDPAPSGHLPAPARVDDPQVVANAGSVPAQPVPERVETRGRVSPLSARSYALQATIDSATQDYVRRAQDLVRHEIPSGDVAQVLKLALKEFVTRREKRKFAATDRPRSPRPTTSKDPRHVPARIKRAVWKRDGGQCTFVSETGHRCEARKGL